MVALPTTPPTPTPPNNYRYRAEDAEALAAEIPRRVGPGGLAVLASDAKREPLRLAGALLRADMDVDDEVFELVETVEGGATTTHRVRVVRARARIAEVPGAGWSYRRGGDAFARVERISARVWFVVEDDRFGEHPFMYPRPRRTF